MKLVENSSGFPWSSHPLQRMKTHLSDSLLWTVLIPSVGKESLKCLVSLRSWRDWSFRTMRKILLLTVFFSISIVNVFQKMTKRISIWITILSLVYANFGKGFVGMVLFLSHRNCRDLSSVISTSRPSESRFIESKSFTNPSWLSIVCSIYAEEGLSLLRTYLRTVTCGMWQVPSLIFRLIILSLMGSFGSIILSETFSCMILIMEVNMKE